MTSCQQVWHKRRVQMVKCDVYGVTLCAMSFRHMWSYVYYVTLHIVCDLHLVTCDAVFLMWLTSCHLWHNLSRLMWLRSWRNSSRVMWLCHTRRYTSYVTFIERLSTFNDDPPSIDHLSASSIIQLNERKRFCQPKEKFHFKEMKLCGSVVRRNKNFRKIRW